MRINIAMAIIGFSTLFTGYFIPTISSTQNSVQDVFTATIIGIIIGLFMGSVFGKESAKFTPRQHRSTLFIAGSVLIFNTVLVVGFYVYAHHLIP